MNRISHLLGAFALTFAMACADSSTTTSATDATDGTDTTAGTDTTGGTTCAAETTTCADFCADASATCPTEWPDAAACETECAMWATGCSGETGGNTLGCRVYHLGAAGADAATHCPHTATDGGGVCI